MPAFLVPVDKGQTVTLDKAVILFGRHPDCDVVLTRSRKVSRKHCCVAQVDHRLVVRDLGSMNGVRINGQKISSQAEIKMGDELAVGDVRYRVTERNGEKKKGKDAAKRAPSKAEKAAAAQLSQDVPVAIPEEEQSFLVEGSLVDVHDEDEDQDDEVLAEDDDYVPPLRDEDVLPPLEDL
jgi:pSer/pThr/pTyr-binding forkhead associated (FHA) protein